MKISNISAGILLVAAVSACNSDQYAAKCSLEGFGEDLGPIAFVVEGNGGQADTLKADGGQVTIKGKIDPTKVIYVTPVGIATGLHAEFIPDVKTIQIKFTPDACKVSGSPLSEALESLGTKLGEAYTEGGEEAYYAIAKETYYANADNAIGVELFSSLAYEVSLDEFDAMMEKGCAAIKEDPSFAKLRESKLVEARTGEGSLYVDFSGKTPDGKDVKLSDYVGKGKYVLVDFWASWCGPCMRSIPGVKSLYEDYSGKGLEVLGVAVWDGDNSASAARMKEKEMTWPQIFVGEDRTPTDSYGIVGIPHVILFDPEGKVVQRGIPDENQLREKVSSLLD